ncbi:MAG TPA: hypothetical protein VMW10_06085, partial [Alphaproteobacteria bacterium]|nr:hypothetical protein [Alphaproteobacteria bacterium]
MMKKIIVALGITSICSDVQSKNIDAETTFEFDGAKKVVRSLRTNVNPQDLSSPKIPLRETLENIMPLLPKIRTRIPLRETLEMLMPTLLRIRAAGKQERLTKVTRSQGVEIAKSQAKVISITSSERSQKQISVTNETENKEIFVPRVSIKDQEISAAQSTSKGFPIKIQAPQLTGDAKSTLQNTMENQEESSQGPLALPLRTETIISGVDPEVSKAFVGVNPGLADRSLQEVKGSINHSQNSPFVPVSTAIGTPSSPLVRPMAIRVPLSSALESTDSIAQVKTSTSTENTPKPLVADAKAFIEDFGQGIQTLKKVLEHFAPLLSSLESSDYIAEEDKRRVVISFNFIMNQLLEIKKKMNKLREKAVEIINNEKETFSSLLSHLNDELADYAPINSIDLDAKSREAMLLTK